MTGERRVGVAMDFSACSKAALRWASENLIRDGDHLIIVNVHKEVPYEGGETQLWEATGSRERLSVVNTLNIGRACQSGHSIQYLKGLTDIIRTHIRDKR